MLKFFTQVYSLKRESTLGSPLRENRTAGFAWGFGHKGEIPRPNSTSRTIDHELLKGFLLLKIKDRKFIRYISRMFKAGVLSEGELVVSDEGVPQGSCCSSVLANIYAHYVIDEWLEDTVKPLMQGKIQAFRYADDRAPRAQEAA